MKIYPNHCHLIVSDQGEGTVIFVKNMKIKFGLIHTACVLIYKVHAPNIFPNFII